MGRCHFAGWFDLRPICISWNLRIDGSGSVDLGDLAVLLANFGTGTTNADGDLNGDGIVDLGDLAMLLGLFGSTCG